MKAILSGGGTGGHIRPAIAIAAELESRGIETTIVATDRDTGFGPLADWNAVYLDAPRLERTPWGIVRFLLKRSQARAEIEGLVAEADFVVGTGGYGSYPAISVALSYGKPLYLQEQNVLPGRVTRRYARKARAVFVQWEETRALLTGKVIACGAPVDSSIIGPTRQQALTALGLAEKPTLLVMGGSQGARPINYAIIGALDVLEELAGECQVIHLTGRLDYAAVSEAYSTRKLMGIVKEFESDMAKLYAASSFAIARAGATSIAELAATGLPALLVPYPHAADRHQHMNAEAAAKSGGFIPVEETDLAPARIREVCKECLLNPPRLEAMREGCRRLHRSDAARVIVDTILDDLKS